jgi:hypothetical protein
MVDGALFADSSSDSSPDPSPDPSLDPGQPSAETRESDVLGTKRKGTFQWPPECVWPFLDRGPDGDA